MKKFIRYINEQAQARNLDIETNENDFEQTEYRRVLKAQVQGPEEQAQNYVKKITDIVNQYIQPQEIVDVEDIAIQSAQIVAAANEIDAIKDQLQQVPVGQIITQQSQHDEVAACKQVVQNAIQQVEEIADLECVAQDNQAAEECLQAQKALFRIAQALEDLEPEQFIVQQSQEEDAAVGRQLFQKRKVSCHRKLRQEQQAQQVPQEQEAVVDAPEEEDEDAPLDEDDEALRRQIRQRILNQQQNVEEDKVALRQRLFQQRKKMCHRMRQQKQEEQEQKTQAQQTQQQKKDKIDRLIKAIDSVVDGLVQSQQFSPANTTNIKQRLKKLYGLAQQTVQGEVKQEQEEVAPEQKQQNQDAFDVVADRVQRAVQKLQPQVEFIDEDEAPVQKIAIKALQAQIKRLIQCVNNF